MTTSNTTARRTSVISLRAFPAQKDLIDRACAASHKINLEIPMTSYYLSIALTILR